MIFFFWILFPQSSKKVMIFLNFDSSILEESKRPRSALTKLFMMVTIANLQCPLGSLWCCDATAPFNGLYEEFTSPPGIYGWHLMWRGGLLCNLAFNARWLLKILIWMLDSGPTCQCRSESDQSSLDLHL